MKNSTALILCIGVLLAFGYTSATAEELEYWQFVEQECAPYRQARSDVAALMTDIKRLYADEPESLQRIIISQEKWQDYLDAHIEAMYHGGTPVVGSVHKLCICHLMMPILETRVQQLRYWRDGTFEGDVCAGHVRRAEDEPAP